MTFAWGTQPDIYSGPTDAPFVDGASGMAIPNPALPEDGAQGIAAEAQVLVTLGRRVSFTGYATQVGGARELVFAYEVDYDEPDPWEASISPLSEFYSQMVLGKDTFCEIFAFLDGVRVPMKLVAVLTKRSDPDFGGEGYGTFQYGNDYYGFSSWYSEVLPPETFWRNFVNAEERTV